MIRMLGLDPGTNNFAFSVVEGNGKKFNILEHGMIRNPFKGMKGDDVGQRGRKFVLEVREIVRYFKITHGTAERFQTRGPKGTTVEEVSVSLGLLWGVGIKPNNLRFITAAQWKNEWNRRYDLKAFYATCGIVPHQVDATNIGLYGLDLLFNIKPHFVSLPPPTRFALLLKKSQES